MYVHEQLTYSTTCSSVGREHLSLPPHGIISHKCCCCVFLTYFGCLLRGEGSVLRLLHLAPRGVYRILEAAAAATNGVNTAFQYFVFNTEYTTNNNGLSSP